jgi:hypothetical protein
MTSPTASESVKRRFGMILRSAPFALICCAAAFAQQPAASTAPATGEAPKKGKLTGSVVNSVSKEPVRRAEVSLMPVGVTGSFGPEGPPGTRRATTDQEGKYAFADVDKGRYTLTGQKSGFLRSSYGSRSPMSMGTQIELSEGQSLGDLKIELIPQGVISGRVVDEENEPLQNVQVMLMRRQFQRGTKTMMPFGNAQTNDRGEFRILNVPPGQVILQISPARMMGAPTGTTDAAPNTAYVPTFYPGVTNMEQATRIDVSPGAELSGFEIKLQKAKVVKVRGKVLDPQGQPAKNYFVNLMPKDSMFFGPFGPQFTRSAEGGFELQAVQPGDYILHVQSDAGGPRGAAHREPLIVGTDNIDDLVIRMNPPVRLEGVIIAKNDAKVDFPSVRIMLVDESGRMGAFGPAGGQQTAKEDGTFVIEGVSPGKYRLQTYFGMMGTTPGEGVYLESIQYGDRDVTGTAFEITPGGAAPLRVVFDSNPGVVEGTVTKDSLPSPGTLVILLNADRSKKDFSFNRTGGTDQNAKFSIKSVPPGDYFAFAFENLQEFGFWEDDERFKKIASKGVKVSVARGGSTNIAVNVTPIPD